MNAESDKLEQSYSKRLAEFAQQLQEQVADEDLLDDIHGAIEDLLWDDDGVEADIRIVLEEQHRAGNLRDETFELIQRMLDRMVNQNDQNPHADPAPEEQGAESSGDTTIVEAFTLNEEPDGDRLQVGSVLRDRFLLQEKVAVGSMGIVYKALDRRLAEARNVGPSVAIKVFRPELSKDVNALRTLQQEAAKGRCLSHPNIVQFIDLDRDDGLYFIVMEWLDGRSLAKILDDSSNKKIDKDTALDMVRQLAKGLEYAHRCGVVHADIKPGNIILSPNGELKLFDFGIARVRQKHFESQTDFDPGAVNTVTTAYLSMQVLTGEEPVAADDVFSLACLLYRLIAGYRVFGPRNAAEAAEAGMESQRPQGLNDIEWAALRKALSYARVSRFASSSDFVDALTATVPMRATETFHTVNEPDDERHRLWPPLLASLFLAAGAWGLYESGLLYQIPSLSLPNLSDIGNQQVETEQSPKVAQVATDETNVGDADFTTDDSTAMTETIDESQSVESIPEDDPIDSSTLPPATVEIRLALPGTIRTEQDLTLREDDGPAIVDLLRTSNLRNAQVVKLEEVSFSGNRSPWESGQYQISNGGVARFAPGQDRARFTVTMAPDPLREPDRQVSVLVRDFEDTETEFALINLTLEDDDQRRFESGLGPNTVAFAVGQVSVRERDPAVQIDLVRFNPDQTSLTVAYFLREVTATEGADYFVPGTNTVHFGPWQRSARILIPLVQDSSPENDEAFVLEMPGLQGQAANTKVFRRIAVMIRDDDSN